MRQSLYGDANDELINKVVNFHHTKLYQQHVVTLVVVKLNLFVYFVKYLEMFGCIVTNASDG